MKTNNILIAGVLIFSLVQTSPVFAEERGGFIGDFQKNVQKLEQRASVAAQRKDEKEKKQLNNLDSTKKRANLAIDRRIVQLNKVLQRIQNDQKLSSDEKTALSTDVQSDISGLNALKVKIDADTDITTLRSDEKGIATNFKVFAITDPKTRLLITINNLQSMNTKIVGFTPKIQDLINTLKSEGKDVTQLQSLLDDVNSRFTTINNQLSSDKTLVLGVTISSTDSKSTFTKVRQDLATVRQSLAQIRHDFAQMREAFGHIIKGESSSPTPSASAAPTSSPTSIPIPTATPTI